MFVMKHVHTEHDLISKDHTMSRTMLFLSTLLIAGDVAGQEHLRAGSVARGSLAEGDTISYTIDAGPNYFVLGDVRDLSVDVVVQVVNPEGQYVARRSSGIDHAPAVFMLTTKRAGQYRIDVIAGEGKAGDFEISLARLEAAETDPSKLVDQLMARYDRDDAPGAAVAVWRNGRTIFSNAYGVANLTYDIPFEVNTRTNIGSTSKQFTAFAIMLQAERGQLSLDDDIRVHLPELPEFEETITVRHLITHTSGLREFLNLLRMSGRRLDHGDYIGRDELIEIVKRQPALQNAPGTEWNYNNTAFGLAAVIVERTSGQAFHEFMADNVFGPLGMTRTMVRPTPEHIVKQRSVGYTPSGNGFVEISDFGGAVGAASIYTTVEDLQTWAENYASPRIGTAEIVEEMMTSYVLTDGKETGYGYGLSVDTQGGLKRVSHGGADVAHRSMLAYYPEINAGITVQSNHAEFNSSVAFQLAAAFFDDAIDPEPEEATAEVGDFDPTSYNPEDFDEMVGRYAIDNMPTFILTFTREGNTLYIQATGQSRFEVAPTSDSTFALNVIEASVTFHRNSDGDVSGATLNQNGIRQHATRLEEEVEVWKPTVKDLTVFAGRYFSEELETFYTAVVEDGQLVMHQRRLDVGKLTSSDKDVFTSDGRMTFSFERDRNKQVVAFYLSNGRTRDVRFERIR